jgi:glutaredoxin
MVTAQRLYNFRMKVQMYGVSWCGDCRAARRFLTNHGVEFTEIDIDKDREAATELVRRVGKRAVPQLVIDGEWFQPYKPGRGLLEDELCQRLGISRD